MMQIAVYGKGGIGKSTISANMSYALAESGKKVLQIGCDPKHDSTRALLGGKEQKTVLDYIRSTPPYDRRIEDVVLEGVKGIKCVEAGGPEPGIGCAGRGILSTFDTLKKLGLDTMQFDIKLYDVLGDVVCGGFAVPLRNEYADGVFLVTSGEFMSIYAANNILKGIKNFDKGVPRVAGIILNSRGMENEYEMVKAFADSVGLPIIATIPRSQHFAEAEAMGRTVMELFPDSVAATELRRVADYVSEAILGNAVFREPHPLDDAQMNMVARGMPVSRQDGDGRNTLQTTGCRTCVRLRKEGATTEKNIISSCATAGAVYGCSSVIDSVTILHGPRSCAHIMSASKSMTEIRKKRYMRDNVTPQSMRILSTDIDDTASVFGGAGLLEQKISDAVSEGQRNIFVVTSCVSGIIGDNVVDIVERARASNPGVRICAVEADGNILGDWEKGYIESANAMLDFVSDSVEADPDSVNLIAERYFFKQENAKDDETTELFSQFGIRVNCRFMFESTTDSLRNFRKGRLCFVTSNDTASIEVSRLIEKRLGMKVVEDPLPVGMRDYNRFAEMLGREFGISDRVSEAVAKNEARYREQMNYCKRFMESRRVIVMDKFTRSIDWLLDILVDMGAEVLLVGIGPTHDWNEPRPPSQYEGRLTYKTDYGLKEIQADVTALSPDMVLTDSALLSLDGVRVLGYTRPGPGVEGILRSARRIADAMLLPAKEGWRDVDCK